MARRADAGVVPPAQCRRCHRCQARLLRRRDEPYHASICVISDRTVRVCPPHRLRVVCNPLCPLVVEIRDLLRTGIAQLRSHAFASACSTQLDVDSCVINSPSHVHTTVRRNWKLIAMEQRLHTVVCFFHMLIQQPHDLNESMVPFSG